MKKKIMVLLSLVVVMSSLLCGCGGTNSSTFIFSSGESLSKKEVTKLDNTYGYLDETVTVEMTVKSVDDTHIKSNDNVYIYYAHTTKVAVDEVAKTLHSGDKIKVTGILDNIGAIGVTVDQIVSIEVIQ